MLLSSNPLSENLYLGGKGFWVYGLNHVALENDCSHVLPLRREGSLPG